jgi:hypothetical protein
MTTPRDYQIRPYGPGKFNSKLDAYVYELSMTGCDDETGSVSECGIWYGRLNGPMTVDGPFSDCPPTADLTESERLALVDMATAGIIIAENDQGFVSVEYYTDKDDLERDWANALADTATGDDDDTDDDDTTEAN